MIGPLPSRYALAVVAALVAAASPALAQAASDAQYKTTTFSLSVSGEAKTAPDMVMATFTVGSHDPTPGQALQGISTWMPRVIAAIQGAGVAPADMQTSNLNLQAEYTNTTPQRFVEYTAGNSVTVKIRDVDRAGAVIDAAVRAGATGVSGVGFALQNPQESVAVARQNAMSELADRIQLYAKSTGYKVVRLVSLSENATGPGFGVLSISGIAGVRAVNAAPAVLAGSQSTLVTLNAVCELRK
ncbi:MAG: hypothetical protein JWM33_473 [Caulobacteraceae bacterium]|nr:hypothetical protein [Caulobacteraceae bacterium]